MNNTIIGLLIITLLWAAGEILATYIPVLPSSIIGMFLLFVLLQLGIVKEVWIEDVASFFTTHLSIFFLPSAVGIIGIWYVIEINIIAILAAILISTICVLLSVGTTSQIITRRVDGKN